MGQTSIEWTDRSINPLRVRLGQRTGHYCEKVSPGCKNCYSSRLQPRFGMPLFQEQRRENVNHFLDWSKLDEVLRRRKPTKWFWCDMTDMFGDWVPIEWIAICFAAMAASPQHTHQVLTKRASRMREVIAKLYEDDGALLVEAAEKIAAEMQWCHAGEDEWTYPLRNVWLGVSAEDQARADERIPHLLETPAAVRFVSAEPLLGPIYFPSVPGLNKVGTAGQEIARRFWVIAGGESGPGARPCDVAWVRSVVEQCRIPGVPVFVKQLGAVVRDRNDAGFDGDEGDAWPEGTEIEDFAKDPNRRYQGAPCLVRLNSRKGGDPSEWPEDLRVRQFPEARV